jgi:hypothetical protein
MAARVRIGVPYQHDSRLRRIEGVVTGLQSSEAAVQADALEGFWSYVGDELRHLRTTEFWNQPVTLPDGRQLQAYQVRLGLVGQLFVTEQGDLAGLATGDNAATPWRTDLPEAVTKQIRAVAEVLRQRKPPGVLAVPIDPPTAVPASQMGAQSKPAAASATNTTTPPATARLTP